MNLRRKDVRSRTAIGRGLVEGNNVVGVGRGVLRRVGRRFWAGAWLRLGTLLERGLRVQLLASLVLLGIGMSEACWLRLVRRLEALI